MSLNNVSDIQTEFLIRNNRTTTDAFISDTTLNNWTREAHVWATGYKKWPFTAGRVSTTYVSGTEEWPYPENWKPDSIRLLKIGIYRYQKLNFEDYQIYREEQASAQDRLYSDFAMLYYINPNVADGGTLMVYGQFQPALDPTDKTATTVFSNVAEEGNEAIVEKMSEILHLREDSPIMRGGISKPILTERHAKEILEELWKRVTDEQYAYQTRDRGMWKRYNLFTGRYRGEINNENRFY